MKDFVGIPNNVKTFVKMSAIAGGLAYFIFHAISGANGLLSFMRTKQLVSAQEEKLLNLTTELESLSLNIALLSDKTLDKDLLEERCRVILNYSLPGDSIIRTKTVFGN